MHSSPGGTPAGPWLSCPSTRTTSPATWKVSVPTPFDGEVLDGVLGELGAVDEVQDAGGGGEGEREEESDAGEPAQAATAAGAPPSAVAASVLLARSFT